MTKIYRGTSKEWVDAYVSGVRPKAFEPTGGGEFGAGSYFWLEDLEAAILSALQYNAKDRDWGVVEVEYRDEDIRRLAERRQGYGSRVLEFKHSRSSCFTRLASNFVVPREYSHLATIDENQDTKVAPAKSERPQAGSYGKMQSEQFRNINASPTKYGIDGEKNSVVWQYDLVVGLCAADYSDTHLVQMKFANHGMTFLNDPERCTRKEIITGKRVVKAWKKVEAWKMAKRKTLYAQYFEGKDEVDLDAVLGS